MLAMNVPSIGSLVTMLGVGVGAFNDLQGPAAGVGDRLGHLGRLITRISKDALDKRKPAPRRSGFHMAGCFPNHAPLHGITSD